MIHMSIYTYKFILYGHMYISIGYTNMYTETHICVYVKLNFVELQSL